MDKIETLYLKEGYFANNYSDIWISIFLILITIALICYNAYKSVIQQVKLNWNLHRCSPIYLPFAGLIMPEIDKSFIDTTIENFQYCIQSDISSVFGVIMMPIEFMIYVTVDCIDAITMIFVAIASFAEWIQEMLGEIYSELFNKIIYAITPIIQIILHFRSITSKTNGVLLTTIFSFLHIYNITISGASFLLTIVINVIGLLIGIFYTLLALAISLCLSFFGIGSGLALLGIAIPMATVVIIPIIIAFIAMANTFQEIFNMSTPKAPSKPSTSVHIRK
jgi:hypothetical protein